MLPDALLTPLAVTRSADGVIVYANPALARLLQHPQDGLVGARLEERLDGLEVDLHTASLQLEDGTPATLTELRDVSAARRAERELAELARFPDMNPGPVLRLDREGAVLLANTAARRVLGDDVVGTSWLARCEGLDSMTWQAILRDGVEAQHETTLGESCYVFTYVPSPAEGFVFAFGADITRRRDAEAQLAELARFPDMNPGPVLRLDREGTVLLANRAARAVFGDILGSPWMGVLPPAGERWEEILGADEPVQVEARVGARDYVFAHRSDAVTALVFVYGTDITLQRRAEHALRQSERMATLGTLAAGVAHELNNPAAATRRAAEQLREALDALGRAQLGLAGVDDTARQVLGRLREAAREAATSVRVLDTLERGDREAAVEEWLDERGLPWELAPALAEQGLDPAGLDQVADALPPTLLVTVLEWLSTIYPVLRLTREIGEGSSRISEIVGALKGYSYLGQGPVQSVDVHSSLDDTLVILRHKLKDGIAVVRDYCESLPTVPAHGSELNQVWTNLLDNAADALAGGGTVTVRTRWEEPWAVVEIEDDGPGIPPDLQSRVFDPFLTTKEPGKGTGLGLSTTHSIVVEKHRGQIDLSSRPGSTRFTVRLPLHGHDSAEA
jgi:signal transduction histidine kinase